VLDSQRVKPSYLDDLAVQSLMASQGIAMPEEITETNETVGTKEGGGKIGGGIDVPMVGSADIGVNASGSKTGREMLETQRRISNQFAFNKLHEELGDEIIDLTENDSLDPEPGDVIKIRAPIKTDAIFRLLKTMSILDDLGADIDKIQDAEELLYENSIGVSIEYNESHFSFTSALDPSNLWVDEERVFLGSKEYVVYGRVFEIFEGDQTWDYIDIAKVADTILADGTMSDIRDFVSGFIDTVGQMRGEYELPDPAGLDVDSFEELDKIDLMEDGPATESALKIDVEDREISVSGPGMEIKPIAIYW